MRKRAEILPLKCPFDAAFHVREHPRMPFTCPSHVGSSSFEGKAPFIHLWSCWEKNYTTLTHLDHVRNSSGEMMRSPLPQKNPALRYLVLCLDLSAAVDPAAPIETIATR